MGKDWPKKQARPTAASISQKPMPTDPADLARAMLRAADREMLARKQTQKAHLSKE